LFGGPGPRARALLRQDSGIARTATAPALAPWPRDRL